MFIHKNKLLLLRRDTWYFDSNPKVCTPDGGFLKEGEVLLVSNIRGEINEAGSLIIECLHHKEKKVYLVISSGDVDYFFKEP
tara:strand:+ start:27 stop:272 length:246 start_codon:yes stop_codon:yes gene_type:complete